MITINSLHLGNKFDTATLDSLADFICGDDSLRFPVYRSSSYLTRFFQNLDINAVHDGSTRKWWTLEILKQLHPSDLEKVILRLSDLREYKGDKNLLKVAIKTINEILLMDNLAVGFLGTTPILKRANPITLDEKELFKDGLVQNESEFLNKQFEDEIKIEQLGLDGTITYYLQNRINELLSCPKNKVSLGSIFLLGSTLEGLLLAIVAGNQSLFMNSSCAPKDKQGTIKKIFEWKLSELIEVFYERGLIGLDVKNFSHVLRNFRNYIHPYQQMSQNFDPDQHTVDICWQVFKATFYDLKKNK
jgi:hypothetical protein